MQHRILFCGGPSDGRVDALATKRAFNTVTATRTTDLPLTAMAVYAYDRTELQDGTITRRFKYVRTMPRPEADRYMEQFGRSVSGEDD